MTVFGRLDCTTWDVAMNPLKVQWSLYALPGFNIRNFYVLPTHICSRV
jgi:hypothetical protein